MSKPILKYLLLEVSDEALVYYMKTAPYNNDEEMNDLMYEELRQRGIFLVEENLEQLK